MFWHILLPLLAILMAFYASEAAPVLQIKNKVWTVPVQAKVQLCRPKGSPQPEIPKPSGKPVGWPLGVAPAPGDSRQPPGQFEDVKKMMWMKKGWAQVPVGTDKPEEGGSTPSPVFLPECP